MSNQKDKPAMLWDPEKLCDKFIKVAELLELPITCKDLDIKLQPKPHELPEELEDNCSAVYIFSTDCRVLKIDRASGKDRNSCYRSQNYHEIFGKTGVGFETASLANSIFKDQTYPDQESILKEGVGDWLKQNCDRVNIILSEEQDRWTLSLLEAFAQYYLRPVYEGRGCTFENSEAPRSEILA